MKKVDKEYPTTGHVSCNREGPGSSPAYATDPETAQELILDSVVDGLGYSTPYDGGSLHLQSDLLVGTLTEMAMDNNPNIGLAVDQVDELYICNGDFFHVAGY